MAELSPMYSLVLGYWESLVVGPAYDMDHQGFQQFCNTLDEFLY